MSEGRVQFCVSDGIASVLFDRAPARNAMTWAMYEQLGKACEAIAADPAIKLAVFRGAGGKAFVAGTDIGQFTRFSGGEDGIGYEKTADAVMAGIENIPQPTIAMIEGWATGGGLLIATACDIRLATPDARLGIPIARTLGNCLSMANMARVMAAFGAARTKRILMLAEMIGPEEALACGFLNAIVPPGDIEAKLAGLAADLKSHAPLTMQAAKEAVRRLTLDRLPAGDDLIRACYGSADFKEGVSAFLAKRKPDWLGR
jgi:enoyl-CoA hydratase/carnithine racemase